MSEEAFITVHNQAELDAALAKHGNDPSAVIQIDSPRGEWVQVQGCSATVRALNSATVRASDSATVLAHDSATVRALNSATVIEGAQS